MGYNRMHRFRDGMDLLLPVCGQSNTSLPLLSVSELANSDGQTSAAVFVLLPASLKTDGGGH